MTDRRGYTIFCDDIRREMGGKVTLVGVYRSEMLIHGKLPLQLPKLGLAVLFQTPVDRPVTHLKLMVCLPGDAEEDPSISGELELPGKEAPPLGDEEGLDHWTVIGSEILLTPIEIRQEGYIRVRAEADGEIIRMGALRIRQVEARTT